MSMGWEISHPLSNVSTGRADLNLNQEAKRQRSFAGDEFSVNDIIIIPTF